jgi:hypothetical protein
MSNSYFLSGRCTRFGLNIGEAKRKAPIIILESRNNLRRNSKAFFAKSPLKSKIGGGISGKIHPQDYQKQS